MNANSYKLQHDIKVCYVYQDQYPWDVRVEKITNTLAHNGMDVHIISRNRDNLARFEFLGDNIYIHRLPKCSHSIIRKLLNFPAFFSPFWLYLIVSVVYKTGSKLIIIRDLPLSITAWIAGKITKRPVIMDMAENYPAMIRDTWRYRGPKLTDHLIRNPHSLRLMEKFILKRMDGILVVSSASAERLKATGVNKGLVHVVGNTPILKKTINDNVVHNIRSKSDLILMYTGGLEETRGIETVIYALPNIVKFEPNVLFVLVGKGTSEIKIKSLSKELNVEKNLLWLGWQDHAVIPSLIQAADICLIPHRVTEHTDTTIPNKLFDYMLQKKPIVATNSKILSEIINSSKCGIIYNDNDSCALANSINSLRNKELRLTLGNSGYNAVMNKYNWKFDELRLLEAVGSVITQNTT